MNIEELSVNTIRMLSLDMIENAKSGHPGICLGASPILYSIYKNMKFNPYEPDWFDRDRFVLSAGHGSAMLYSMLHLLGFHISKEDLKSFRQGSSVCPGHPEYGNTPGVDATTGPLGQGLAMAVGMAIAESHMASMFNKNNFNIIDHNTFVLCGDGDLMEGISSEAASLAGQLKLGKLIVLYDSNNVSLDGDTDLSFTDNIPDRFRAMNWDVIEIEDGNNIEKISNAIKASKYFGGKPTLIKVNTKIGFGIPEISGTNEVHGSPIGEELTKQTKQFYNWNYEPFEVPDEVFSHFSNIINKNIINYNTHINLLIKYKQEFPGLYFDLMNYLNKKVPKFWDGLFSTFYKPISTRDAAGKILNESFYVFKNLIGGAADVASSTKTKLFTGGTFSSTNPEGCNINFGVREFSMAAITNGISLHGGLIPYCSTFFTFSDYAKPAIRLAALMKIPSIFIFTHDSVAVGEDGPTHQPIEQLAGLRAIPNLNVIRPADGNETRQAIKIALTSNNTPTVIVLTRQTVDIVCEFPNVYKGAYIVSEEDKDKHLQGIFYGTGSEVSLCIEAQKILKEKNINTQVVSVPCMELFNQCEFVEKLKILQPNIKARLSVEAASTFGWESFLGSCFTIGINEFGKSDNGDNNLKNYNFTPKMIATAMEFLSKKCKGE